jgi:hypothetical protein
VHRYHDPTKEMDQTQRCPSSISDNLISWTTASALIALGILFLDDAIIMGRTILVLGLISATDQVLKWNEILSPMVTRYRRARLMLSIAYVALVLVGFLFPPRQ